MGVELQLAYDRLDDVQALFAEYTTVIAGQRADVATCLASQHYEEELQNLEGKYGLPGGRLYLAYLDGDCAGCGALTRNSPQYAELKRLYVRPRFRGRQIGRRLVEQLLADATGAGYLGVRLDTFPFMESAIRLYECCGFTRIGAYNDNPIADAVFMERPLFLQEPDRNGGKWGYTL
ncbi:MAG: GNAT family N-acetyltransferase [Oscillibacter sp.]|nr:GNAT family N-acetyltransferase [Oscillibacter sp.]